MIVFEEILMEDDRLIMIKSTHSDGQLSYRIYYKPRWNIFLPKEPILSQTYCIAV